MATKTKYLLSVKERRLRHFSESFKIKKVRELEQKQSRITDICRTYQLSATSVRRWIAAYSSQYSKGVRIMVESESDTKKIQELKAKIAELERLLGQKQVMLEFKDKMIDLAEETYGVDIKKKFESQPSSGSGDTEKSSDVA